MPWPTALPALLHRRATPAVRQSSAPSSRLSSVPWCSEVPEASWGVTLRQPQPSKSCGLGRQGQHSSGEVRETLVQGSHRAQRLPLDCGPVGVWQPGGGTLISLGQASIHLAGCTWRCDSAQVAGLGPDVSPVSLSPEHLPLLSWLVPVVLARCVRSSCPWPGQCLEKPCLWTAASTTARAHQQQRPPSENRGRE